MPNIWVKRHSFYADRHTERPGCSTWTTIVVGSKYAVCQIIPVTVVTPPARVRSIVMRVSVCLHANISHEPFVRGKYSVHVASFASRRWLGSSTVGIVVRYVLPVLWFTSWFPIISPYNSVTIRQQPRCNVCTA